MKKVLILLVAAISVLTTANAQSDKYLAAMKASVAAIDTSFKNPENMLSLSNKFERIGNAEKSQWLPYYYASLCQINYVFASGKTSLGDEYAEKAEALLNKADSLSPNNSEISVVRSMIATLRMIVNPMQRFMQYGMEIEKQFKLAMEQDENNPRPYYLKAQNLKNTPPQFGGGCGAALPLLETAMEKYKAFKPASEIAPNWGMERTLMLLQECKK